MKSKLLLFIYFLLFAGVTLTSIPVIAQEQRDNVDAQRGDAQQDVTQQENPDDPSLWDKIYVGGNFSLQLGYFTYIDVSPMVGYRFTSRFSAGPGITYRYLKVRNYDASSTYGGKIFARYLIGKQFFIHSEYESLNTEVYFTGRDRIVRDWVPGFFVGGGIYQPIGERAAVLIYGLYNLLYDNVRSPYPNPWVITVGFTI